MNDITDEIIAFRDERDWAQFHTPSNLARQLSVEAGELLDCFRWDKPPAWDDVCEELADVLIYALTMCHDLGATPESIIRRKLDMNAVKYPVTDWSGRAW